MSAPFNPGARFRRMNRNYYRIASEIAITNIRDSPSTKNDKVGSGTGGGFVTTDVSESFVDMCCSGNIGLIRA